MLSIDNLTVRAGGRELFSPISMSVPRGQVTVIMGNSGVGKTSLLATVAEYASSFTVFQDSHQLLPWYSVRKNLDLVCKQDYTAMVCEWELHDLLDHKPNDVSGGQRQRFTLIRAMCSGAKVLLCDEPLSGLDLVIRRKVARDFKKKVQELGLSSIWVTHDLNEAKLVGDEISLLDAWGLKAMPRNINEKSFIKELGN
jgi:multiple sugar transport system ATP-binding protein